MMIAGVAPESAQLRPLLQSGNSSPVNGSSTGRVAASRLAMLRRRGLATLCATALMLQQGCYRTVPVAGASTLPQGTVTITVNDQGRLMVGNRLGSLLDHVTGRIIRADADTLHVAVETAHDVRGVFARWGGEPFSIPRAGVASITEKKTDKKRTALVIGGIALGLVLGLLGLKGKSSGSDGPKPPGGNEI